MPLPSLLKFPILGLQHHGWSLEHLICCFSCVARAGEGGEPPPLPAAFSATATVWSRDLPLSCVQMPLPCLLKLPILGLQHHARSDHTSGCAPPRTPAGEEGMALSNVVIFLLMALPYDSRLSFVKLFPLLLVFECCRVFVFTSLSNHFPSDGQDTSPPPHPNLFSSCFWSLRPQGAKIFRVFSSESRFYMVFSGVKAQVPLKFHSLL